MTEDDVIVNCTHSIVDIETTDGGRRTISTCQIGADDIDNDGRLDWPPSGECSGPFIEDMSFEKRTCDACDREIEPGWSYCAHCGRELWTASIDKREYEFEATLDGDMSVD